MVESDGHSIAFPKFTELQLASLESCPLTTHVNFQDGEKLYEAGQCDSRFYVIKSGEVVVVDETGETPKTFAVHERGNFTGDVSQLAGNPALVSGIARGNCEAYAVSPGALRQLLNAHPDLADMILKAFLARRHLLLESVGVAGLRVIGSGDSQDTFRIRDFLAKNRAPFVWLDLEGDPQAKQLLERLGGTEADTPFVIPARKPPLRNPSTRQVAEALGLCRPLEKMLYDLIVVGAGPAGLAAAVYGASEGLSTLVLERTAPGGQAGRSMRIENYLGFPIGVTGSELTERAVVQANKFGARLPVAVEALSLTFDGARVVLQVDGGETVTGKSLIIASGADYRLLGAEGCAKFEGRGVYYAATPIEAQMCQGSEVVVVGGGNSAGQAAVFLSGQVRRVYIVIRGDDLNKGMSTYLVRRIELTPNIELIRNSEVRRMSGNSHLAEVELVNIAGAKRSIKTSGLFSFIGAVPRTDWLPAEIERDAKRFILTGAALAQSPRWTGRRQPFLLETSRPGVFAAGDVRAGSVKRFASAVGEGSMAVQFVHEYMREL